MLRACILSALTASVLACAQPAKAQLIIEACTPLALPYCYESGLDTTVTFFCSDPLSEPLTILFCSGQMELTDTLVIYDGPDVTYPQLYAGNGNFGDFTGVFAMVTNAANTLTVRIHTHDSVDCQSEGYVPIWMAVGPNGTFTDCSMGVAEADGANDVLHFTHQNGQFVVQWPSMRSANAMGQLSDMAGRERWSGQLKFDPNGQALLPLNELENGPFVLRVATGGRVRSASVVIVR
jgi:hypothetical protein